MRKRRASDGFNMSFIDVMACGLGAVILIFILVDFYAATVDPSDELTRLERELSAASAAEQNTSAILADIVASLAASEAQQNETEQARQARLAEQEILLQEVAQQLAVIAELENELAALAAVPTPDSAIELAGRGEQNYITGMVVEGREIGILIDRSASMMDGNLLDILRSLALSPSDRQQRPKWQRTVRSGQWLLARVPEEANVTVVSFAEDATVHGPQAINKGNNSQALSTISSELAAAYPNGGSNLLVGMQQLFAANPNITDVYLITDGLPTLGEGLNLSCRNMVNRTRTISSDCRQQLTLETIRRVPGRYRMNVVLLPLAGDPYAASLYWEWTNASKGRLLFPAEGWP